MKPMGFVALLLAGAASSACDEGKDKESAPVWKEQVKAMEKARDVENVLLESAQSRRRQTEQAER